MVSVPSSVLCVLRALGGIRLTHIFLVARPGLPRLKREPRKSQSQPAPDDLLPQCAGAVDQAEADQHQADVRGKLITALGPDLAKPLAGLRAAVIGHAERAHVEAQSKYPKRAEAQTHPVDQPPDRIRLWWLR